MISTAQAGVVAWRATKTVPKGHKGTRENERADGPAAKARNGG